MARNLLDTDDGSCAESVTLFSTATLSGLLKAHGSGRSRKTQNGPVQRRERLADPAELVSSDYGLIRELDQIMGKDGEEGATVSQLPVPSLCNSLSRSTSRVR